MLCSTPSPPRVTPLVIPECSVSWQLARSVCSEVSVGGAPGTETQGERLV